MISMIQYVYYHCDHIQSYHFVGFCPLEESPWGWWVFVTAILLFRTKCGRNLGFQIQTEAKTSLIFDVSDGTQAEINHVHSDQTWLYKCFILANHGSMIGVSDCLVLICFSCFLKTVIQCCHSAILRKQIYTLSIDSKSYETCLKPPTRFRDF